MADFAFHYDHEFRLTAVGVKWKRKVEPAGYPVHHAFFTFIQLIVLPVYYKHESSIAGNFYSAQEKRSI
jgi:hypothetical protein